MSELPKPVRLAKEKPVRCAIYLNSNLDGGAAADRNAIQMQRQLVQRYIARRRDDGWTYSTQEYEDIGQRGGPMKRPAMRRLLADAEAGKLDCVAFSSFDCVTLSVSCCVKLARQLERYGVVVDTANQLPARLCQVLSDCYRRSRVCPREAILRHQQLQRQQHAIRCGIYVRGSRRGAGFDDVLPQRKAIVKFLAIWRLNNAQHVETAYQDIDLPEHGPPQPALKRLLKDVDAGKMDCVIVHTFDRLTERLISHEALLKKLRQREVALLSLWPHSYHIWGRRLERAWIGDMPRFLRATARWQTDEEKERQARHTQAATG